jgi:hypothetical protein
MGKAGVVLATLLLFTGCFFVVDDNQEFYDEGDPFWEVWLEDPYVSCNYYVTTGESRWYIEIYADSVGGPDDIIGVTLYLDTYEVIDLGYAGQGRWAIIVTSYYYDCYSSHYLQFVGTDYYGYEGYYSMPW